MRRKYRAMLVKVFVLAGVALFLLTAEWGKVCHASPINEKEPVLNIGTINPPTSLNFFGATDLWSKRILRLFHMPLYVRGPAGDNIQPWLATGPPLEGTFPNEIIITLRDAKWNDGTPVTAADLAFTVQTIQEFKVPGLIEKWRDVADVEAVDHRTIRFVLSHSSPDFFSRALRTGFVQKKAWQPVVQAARNADDGRTVLLMHQPIHVSSNGPFYLSTNGMPYFLVLKKNPFFFGDGLNVDGVQNMISLQGIMIHFYRSARGMLQDFEQGKTEFLWSDLTNRHVARLKKDRVTIHRTPRTGYDYLGFNLERTPFDDDAFRKAVALLVDRKSLIQHTLMGEGEPVVALIPPYNTKWHLSEIQWIGIGLDRKQRMSKARAILKNAGYGWHRGVLCLPDKTPMDTMTILTTSSGAKGFRTKVLMALKKELFHIGVPVRPVILEMSELLAAVKKGDFDAYLLGWASLPEDPGYLRTFFHSSEAQAGGRNYVQFRNEVFDQLAENASEELDTGKRKAMVDHMQTLLAEKRPILPLYTTKRVEATRKDLYRGWVALPGGVGNLWSFLNIKPIHHATEEGSE